MNVDVSKMQFCLENLEGRLLLSADPSLIAADPAVTTSPTAEVAELFDGTSQGQDSATLSSAGESAAFDIFEDVFGSAAQDDDAPENQPVPQASQENAEALCAESSVAAASSSENHIPDGDGMAPDSQTDSSGTEMMVETLTAANPPPDGAFGGTGGLSPSPSVPILLIGVPNWVTEGPETIANGSATVAPNNPVTGAVQSIAINPNNGQQIYVGSVNGGIWRTNNADPANPGAVSWTPLTDQQASLAIGSIEFSPLDPTRNTLYAGTGTFSNLTWAAPPPTAVGILRTTDGGATWVNFAVNPGNEGRIKAVLPTGVDLDAGAGVQEMILVAEIDGGAGLYRSNDNGQTFALLSGANGLPAGAVSQLIVDPNNAQRYYAALPGQGVFRGDFNAGTGVIAWTQVNGTNPNNLANVGTSANIQIAAHDDGANTVLYAGLAGAVAGGTVNATLTGVFRSTDAGANWAALGAPNPFNAFALAGSGFNLVADANPANNQVVYVSGLATTNNIARFNPATNTWVSIIGAGAQNNTTPHVDSRDMTFIGNNILVEADDGGIYFLQNPTDAANNSWQSFIGDAANGNGLGIVEFHNIAWDANSDIIIGGAQDNATSSQQSTGNLVYGSLHGGDGGDVIVDIFTLDAANQSIRYFSSQNLGIGFNSSFRRQVYGANNATVGAAVAVLPAAGLANFTAQFINPVEINAIGPTAAQIAAGQSTRVVLGGGGTSPVYESNNAGTAAAPVWTAVPVPAAPNTLIGTVTALAYGGRRAGVDNPDVLYVGDNNGNVFVRTTAGGPLTITGTAFPGGQVQDIALDPNDWQHAFVIDANGVWETTNAGAAWIPRTGNLSAIQGVTAGNNVLQTVEYGEQGAVDSILVGGWRGVFRMITNNPNVWSEYGQFLPNAVVFDLDFVEDDPDNNAANGTGVLIAGTFGSGAWAIMNASSTLTVTGVLQIFGDQDFTGQDDTIQLVREGTNPSLLNVFLNGDFSQYQLSTIQQINVFGLGGNDTLITDSTNGLINVGNGIRYYGDDGADRLQLVQTGGPIHMSDTYSVGPSIGSGLSTIVGTGLAGTQTVFFEDLSPVLDLVPAASLTVNATPADNALNYTAGSLVTYGKVTIDEHESIEFANKTSLVINAGAGRDSINLNHGMTPTGLAGLTVRGEDDTVGDVLVLNGFAATLGINTATRMVTGANGSAGNVPVTYATMELLTVVAGSSTRLSVSGSADYTVNPGTRNDEGTILADAISVQYLDFGASQSLELNGTGELVIHGTAANDILTVASGTGNVTVARRAMIERAGTLSALVLNGLEGNDLFYISGAQPYTTIEVAGGSGTSNLAKLTGDGTAMTLDIEEDMATVTGGGLGTVRLSGIVLATLNALNSNLTVRSTVLDDEVEVTPMGLNSGRVTASPLAGMINFSNTGTFSVNLLGGQDALRVRGSSGPETILVSGTVVEVTGREAVNYSQVEHLEILSLAGSDIVQVSPSGMTVLVDGGDPIATAPGDLLTIETGGAGLTLNPGPQSDEGSFNVGANGPVSFDHVESFSVTGGGPLIINGTNGPDAISLVARDASTHAGTNGVRDFTVSINGTSDFLFIDVPVVTVMALGGSDEIVLRTPAPNQADWDVDVTINGGTPSGSDRFVVETPGPATETVTFTPSGIDAGSLSISQINPLNATFVTFGAVEELVYDGEGDHDHLTLIGTAGLDTTTHRPGATDDSGQLRLNSWLALDYQSLGADAQLSSDGAGGNNSLVYDGTEGADRFQIERTLSGGQVNLNNRVGLRTVNTQSLIVQSFDGDDTVTLLPAIQDSPYSNITVNGGTEASSSGDVLDLVGSDNADVLTINGRRVSAGGVTVDGTGIEETRLDAKGGADQITYQGVAGLSEAVNLIGSGVAGSSKLVVADLATYTLTHAELFDAHANDGTAGDIDTLRFTGTNQSDVINIDLNAAGTFADPILEFRDVTGANLLLTLFNYTGFRTLNVFGEDGQDFFHVYTGADVGRELFVDGGLPAGKRRTRPDDTTDELRVYVVKAPNLPRVTHNAETQNQNSGFIEVLYDNGIRFPVQYDNMEFIDIIKLI